MRIPEENYSEQPLITPERSVRLKAEAYGLRAGDLRVPKHILLSLTVAATSLLVKYANAKPVKWLYKARPLYIGNVNGFPVGVTWAAPGAPLATFVMEDLIACGAEAFIGVGSMGAIQPDIQVGDSIIPVEAIRDEGTSPHYLPRDIKAVTNDYLASILKDACRKFKAKCRVGSVWTTDAPYRETESKIKYFQTQGVLGVDMETSAIFSLGIHRNVKVGCILVTQDSLANFTSLRGLFLENQKLKQSRKKAAKIAIETIRMLAKKISLT